MGGLHQRVHSAQLIAVDEDVFASTVRFDETEPLLLVPHPGFNPVGWTAWLDSYSKPQDHNAASGWGIFYVANFSENHHKF